MYKILVAVAVVAVAALSTTVIATTLLRSSISSQARQISVLDRAQHSDQVEIAALEKEVGAAIKHKKLTAAHRPCAQLPQPIGQPGVAMAGPQLLFTVRPVSVTDWNVLAGVRASGGSTPPDRCG